MQILECSFYVWRRRLNSIHSLFNMYVFYYILGFHNARVLFEIPVFDAAVHR